MKRLILIIVLLGTGIAGWSQDEVFIVVEESAQPIGGMKAFYKHVQKNLKYPAQARRHGIEGRVFVEFIIEKDGSLSNVKVIKGIGGGCDEEAVSVIASSPDWTPGKQEGEPVKQKIVLPLTFELGGKHNAVSSAVSSAVLEDDDDESTKYFVKLNSGEKVYGDLVKFKSRTFGKSHFDLDGERFEKAQVKAYQNHNGYYLKATSPGGYNPTFFLREMHGSKISTYSITSTTYNAGAPGMYGGGFGGGGTFTTSKVGYYTVNEGQMRKLSYGNLKLDLGDYAPSAIKLQEVKKIRTIHTLVYLAGSAMLIGGIADTFNSSTTSDIPQNDGPNISPLVIVGAITLWIPWLTKGGKEKRMTEAIRLYNE